MARAIVASVLLIGLCGGVASAMIIDDFATGPIELFVARGDPSLTRTQEGLADDHVAGGERLWRYGVRTQYGATPPAGSGVAISVDSENGGRMVYDADPGLTAVSFWLWYDGGESGMDLDLTQGGADSWAMDFAFADFAGGLGYLDVTMDSPSGGVDYFVPISSSPLPFTIVVPFRPVDHHYDNNLDPHHVTDIWIGTSNGNLFGSFALDCIRTVPEPSMMVLLVSLLAGHGLASLRSRSRCLGKG